MKLIETLFDYLILQNSSILKGWATEYRDTLKRFDRIKELIKAKPNLSLDDIINEGGNRFKTYENFMYYWLIEWDNHISSRGQSNPSHEKFKELIKDDDFKKLSKALILEYSEPIYEEFKAKWAEYMGQNNWLLYHRALAAYDDSLTCVVDEPKFREAENYLKTKCKYEPIPNNWYNSNKNLTEWLDEELKEIFAKVKRSYTLKSLNSGSLTSRQKDFYATRWVNILRNIFVWEIYYHRPNMFDLKKSIVKYGAPGTGKTYTCKTDASNHFNFWKAIKCSEYTGELKNHLETVQFHPSFTYEDFMEGIKPVLKDGKAELKLTNGIFKSFCKKAAQWELDIYHNHPEVLKNRKKEKIRLEDVRIKDVKDRLKGDLWNYLSTVEDNNENEPKYLHEHIPPFYFIIDEINRAELSRVMGELMLCLEYRGLEGKIKTQYSSLSTNSTEDKTRFWYDEGNYFFIPHNVHILATMNTIDRSVESFDFALRRRFRWQEVGTNYEVLAKHLMDNETSGLNISSIQKGLKCLNETIEKNPLLGRDFQIGHAYLMNLPKHLYQQSAHDFKNTIWESSIKPLLEEYLRGSGDIDGTMKGFKVAFDKSN